MQLDATERRDLRHACHHEYAHLHVARHFGVHGHVVIERNPDGGTYESHYVGKLHLLGWLPGLHARAMVGLAGTVAEYLCAERFTTPEQLFEDLTLDPEALSRSDRRYVGEITLRKVAAALYLVRRLWPDIEADANQRATVEERVALEVAAAAPTPPKKSRPKAA